VRSTLATQSLSASLTASFSVRLPERTGRRQTFQHQQPAARHGHVAQPMAGLVRPFGPGRKRHIDKQHAVEIHDGVFEHHSALDLPYAEIQGGVGRGGFGRLRLQRLQFLEFAGQIDGRVVLPDSRGELAGPLDFLANPLGRRVSAALVKPIALELLVCFLGREVPHRGRVRPDVGGYRFMDLGAELDPRAGRQDQFDPLWAVAGGGTLSPQGVEAGLELFRLGPLFCLLGR